MLDARTNNHAILRKKGLLRVITVITLWSFLFSMGGGEKYLIENVRLRQTLNEFGFGGQAWAARPSLGLTSVSSNAAGGPTSIKEFNVETFVLPRYLGKVKDAYKGTSGKTIIHIQDAHCNYAAQRKINDIVQYFADEYEVEVVNMEGGRGGYDLSVFSGIPNENTRKKVADYFVKEGLLNGVEYFAINNPEKITLWGVEDANLYLKNLNIYRRTLKDRETINKYLKELDHVLGNLKRNIYSEELLELDEKYRKYKESRLDFKGYLTYLIGKAKQMAINIKMLTNIYLLDQSLKQEEEIDFQKANMERNRLLDELEKMLSKKEVAELIVKTIGFKTEKISQKDYYQYLVKKAKLVNIDLKKYPKLQKYIVYISLYSAIEKSKVMAEIDTLENEIKKALYANKKQRELDILSKNLTLTKNTFNISLTKEDYEYYVTNKDSFNIKNYVSFIKKEAPIYRIKARLSRNIEELDRYRENMGMFYKYSFKRDKAFMENMKFTEKEKSPPFAILVTGGFHTENLCDMFKKKNISYISIIPNFRISEGYESPYFNLLGGSLSPIEKTIEASLSSIQIASPFNQMGEDVNGIRGVNRAELASLILGALESRKSVVVRRGDGVLLRFSGSIEEGVNTKEVTGVEVDITVNNAGTLQFHTWLGQERFEDAQLARAEHKPIDDKIVRRAADFFRSIGREDVAAALENLAKEDNDFGGKRISFALGLRGFAGHAGGQGIHINGEITNEDDLTAILIHEAIAYFFTDETKTTEELHKRALAFENRFRGNTLSASQDAMIAGLPREIRSVTSGMEKGRDFQKVPHDMVPSTHDDAKIAVSFTNLISALRNHIGKTGSSFYENMKKRILNGEQPVTTRDRIGNVGQVNTLGTFIDEHFALPEEAVREIITNAYDSMHHELTPERREVRVRLRDNFLSVTDNGSGMSLDTILKKLLPPFEGGKSSDILAELKNITDDGKSEKISRIKQLITAIDTTTLSDTERLTINDIRRRVEDDSIDEAQRLSVIKNIATFTGRFGIGFYSLLYFLKTDEDSIEVVTSTGTEAYRVRFFRRNGQLQTAIVVLNPDDLNQGTTVSLKSQSFNKSNAQKVINKFLGFNANGKISVSVDGMAPTIINEEVFNQGKFEHISDDTQVEAFYSRGENISGKTTVYINVHGVTIMTKEIDGFGMPETVVFNFPANIGLPISRNKIDLNEIFIEKAKDMIQLIVSKPELLSAFFPCIEVLESSAKASHRNILANTAADAACRSWETTSLVYLPNEQEYTKVKRDGVALVDGKLLRMVFFRGLANYYNIIGEPLIFDSGEEAVIGNKYVYLVDFTDETKFVVTSDAILINQKHVPEIDSDKALYNVLLELSREGRFGYVYQPQGLAATGAEQGLTGEAEGSSSHADTEEIEQKVQRILDSLPDERAKSHFEAIVVAAPRSSNLLQKYIDNPALFLTVYNGLVKSGLIDNLGHDVTKIYARFSWSHVLENKAILQMVFENEQIKQLQGYLKDQGRPELIIDILIHLLDTFSTCWATKGCSQQVRHQALERLWDLREFLSNKTYRLITSASLLDADTYEKFSFRLKSDIEKINSLKAMSWRVFDDSVQSHKFSSSATIPFQLFLEGDFVAIKRIAKIHALIDEAYNDRSISLLLAVSMRNMSDGEIKNFIQSGGVIDETSFDLRYGNIGLMLYYFRSFYGNEWKNKLNFYLGLKNRSNEIWNMEHILQSDIPIQQKKNFIEAIIENVSSSETETREHFDFPFDFAPELLSQIKNPALFVQFISHLSPFETEFLYKKHSLERQDENVPLGYQYRLRYKDEFLRKSIVIFQHISDLPINEFNTICSDFDAYFSEDKMTARIEPYIQYLLNSQDAADIKNNEIDVQSPRKFTLVGLYDTFLELSSEEEVDEESAGINGDFNGVDRRIKRVAQKSAQQLTAERRKLLRNTFRAAAQQSVDDLVMIREAVQNVLDETPADAENQRVSINTYRKTLMTPEGEQELTVIDIKDTIGMNAERLFNKLLMPFSSSKKDPKKFRGKQGQGFFTLLANSEYVKIKTVRDGKVRILKLTPEKQNGQVVDFQVEEQVRDALAGEENGTRIQAFIRSALPGLEAARVSFATQKYASLVDSDRLRVEVDGRQINLNRGRRFAVERSRYGEVEFYSVPGESFMALGGLFVKPIDDELLVLVAPALKSILLEHGFAINLPFQEIKRIQGGSDIANRKEIYDGIKDAVALGTMKLVIAMFARGELPSLGLLGDDYYNWVYDQQAARDAQELMDGSADIDYIRAKYFSSDSTNRLAKLLLAIPLDFPGDVFGRAISLAEIFEKFKTDRQFFTDSVIAKLPQPIKDAFKDIEEREKKKASQQEAADELGIPEQLIGGNFIVLPGEQGEGMAAYWAFLEMSDAVARIGIEAMLEENSAETLGPLQERLEYLRNNPTSSHYYAEANGLSMAYAHQGGGHYAWNLLEQEENLKLFYQYLNKQISLAEFLDKAFENIIGTLSHELIHILEKSAEGSHNDVFLKRQKLMISAMIGERKRIAAVLADIGNNTQYTNNLQDVQIKGFLDYIVRSRAETLVDAGQVVVSTDTELTVAKPGEAPLLVTSQAEVTTSVPIDRPVMPLISTVQANEKIESRKEAIIDAYASYSTRGDNTISLVGVEEGKKTVFHSIISVINRVLGRNGHGQRGARQLYTFTIFTSGTPEENERLTKESYARALEKATATLTSERTRIYAYTPQSSRLFSMRTWAEGLLGEAQFREHAGQIRIVSDAYTDLNCTDVHARDAFSRLMSFYENTDVANKPRAFNNIAYFLQNISGLDISAAAIQGLDGLPKNIETLEDLLKYLALDPLKIDDVWEDVAQMQRSYKAVETAL